MNLRVYLDTELIATLNTSSSVYESAWEVIGEIVRTSPTGYTAFFYLEVGTNTGGLTTNLLSVVSGTMDWSVPHTLKLTGEKSNAGETVRQNAFFVDKINAPV